MLERLYGYDDDSKSEVHGVDNSVLDALRNDLYTLTPRNSDGR